MHCTSSRWTRAVAITASLASLAACGGGGDGAAATATIDATDDYARTSSNVTIAMRVARNDHLPGGPATLEVTIPPDHGTAVIEQDFIRYKPSGNYHGTDGLKYRVTAGGQLAEAYVWIVIDRDPIGGTLPVAKLGQATIVATVDGVDMPAAKADADGRYRISLATAETASFVRLRATGAGPHSHLVLSSVTGDTDRAADLTALTTAVAALAEQVLGRAPVNVAELSMARALIASDRIVEAATAVRLLVDEGAALPEGFADTLALLAHPDALHAFLAAEEALHLAAFTRARQAVLDDIAADAAQAAGAQPAALQDVPV